MIPVMIVAVLARPELLHRMLASIDHPVGTLVVIDNGHCLPDGIERNELISSAYVLRMPSNLGVATSWNLGIKATPFAPWWLVCGFDVVWPAGALAAFAAAADRDSIALSAGHPPWTAFTIGDRVIEAVGLFDESLHPAYYEDDDMTRRCVAADIPVRASGIFVHHDNSSTLAAGYGPQNSRTFGANAAYYGAKAATGDLSEGRWSLRRRREQSWD